MLRRSVYLVAFVAVAFAQPASAEGLTATASCNGKWVNVTVDAPNTVVVVAFYGGKAVAVGARFVPDTGGGNPAGDYDMDIRLETWDSTTIATHKVLAAGSVHTPNCAPVATTTTVPTTTTTTTLAAPKLVTVAYDPWPAIVEAVRALP